MENKRTVLMFLIVTVVLIIVGLVLIGLDYNDGVEITFRNFLPIIALMISGGLFFNSYQRKK